MTETESRRNRKIYQPVGKRAWIWPQPHFPKQHLRAALPSSLKHIPSRSPQLSCNCSQFKYRWVSLASLAATRNPFFNSLFALPSLGTQMMNAVKGHTPLSSPEGANAALLRRSLLLLYLPSTADAPSGRCPCVVCPGTQDVRKIWSWLKPSMGKYSCCLLAAGVNTSLDDLHNVIDLPGIY